MPSKRTPKELAAPLTQEALEGMLKKLSAPTTSADEVVSSVGRLKASASTAIPFLVEQVQSEGDWLEIASMLLRNIGGPQVIAPLREMIRQRTASDDAKLNAASILDDLGEQVDLQWLVRQLRDPEEAFRDMWDGTLGRASWDEPFREYLLTALEDTPEDLRDEVISSLAEPGDKRVACLLIPLMYSKKVHVAIAAIDTLEKLVAEEAIPHLRDLSRAASSRQLKSKARAVYGRLTMLSGGPPNGNKQPAKEPRSAALSAPVLPLSSTMVSLIDGDGTQAVLVSRRRPDGLYRGLLVLVNDLDGIKECLGMDMLKKEDWEKWKRGFEDKGLYCVKVDLGYCRQIVGDAHATTVDRHRRVPMSYEIWKTFLEDGARDGCIAVPEGAMARRCKSNLQYLDETAALLKEPAFSSWFFDVWQVSPFLDKWVNQAASKKRKARETRWREVPAEIVDLACREMVNSTVRSTLYKRLLRQAWLLQKLGDKDQSRQALAAAAGLDEESGVPSEKHPFVREMVKASLVGACLVDRGRS